MHVRSLLIISLILALICCAPPPSLEGLATPIDTVSLARGRELVHGLAACGSCHGELSEPNSPLIGGREVFDEDGVSYKAPNITPALSGLKAWTVLEVLRAVREGSDRSDRKFSYYMHGGMEWLSESDTLAIVGYLSSLPPIEHSVERSGAPTFSFSIKKLFESHPGTTGYVPAISQKSPVAYGGYLVENVARCIRCHNTPSTTFGGAEYLQGGQLIRNSYGEKRAPGIGSSQRDGIGSWSEAQIVSYLQSGKTPSGEERDSHFCPINFYKSAPEGDLVMMAKYLKSLPVAP